jgi:hypothetical protein
MRAAKFSCGTCAGGRDAHAAGFVVVEAGTQIGGDEAGAGEGEAVTLDEIGERLRPLADDLSAVDDGRMDTSALTAKILVCCVMALVDQVPVDARNGAALALARAIGPTMMSLRAELNQHAE